MPRNKRLSTPEPTPEKVTYRPKPKRGKDLSNWAVILILLLADLFVFGLGLLLATIAFG